jgi:hypothetical protein
MNKKIKIAFLLVFLFPFGSGFAVSAKFELLTHRN